MPSFVEIGSPVPEKLLRVFTSHLGHVTWIISIHISSNSPYMFHIKFGFIGQAASEKIFEYYGYIHVLLKKSIFSIQHSVKHSELFNTPSLTQTK